jgi:hypothetical protein
MPSRLTAVTRYISFFIPRVYPGGLGDGERISSAFLPPRHPGYNRGMEKPKRKSVWKWIKQAAFPAKAIVIAVGIGMAAGAWLYVAVVIGLVAIAFGLSLFVNLDNPPDADAAPESE